MKTERRHELQKNELADWLGDKLIALQKYSGAIGASVVAVVVLIALGIYLSNRSASQTALAWERYFRASTTENTDELKQLADNLSSAAGQWARLRLADQQLDQATNQLFQDPVQARKSLAGAVDNYRWLAEHSSDKLLQQRATLGLAKTYESEDKLPEAREQYEKLVKSWPDSVYGTEAKNRLRDLDKKSTREFYDWFAQRETSSPAAKGPGIPGLKPKFDTSSLPADEPDIKFQHGPQLPAGHPPINVPPAAPGGNTPAASKPASGTAK